MAPLSVFISDKRFNKEKGYFEVYISSRDSNLEPFESTETSLWTNFWLIINVKWAQYKFLDHQDHLSVNCGELKESNYW
jgi:hypothetical protein